MQTDDSVSNVIAANLTKSLQACKTRVILTEEQVMKIYLIKLANVTLVFEREQEHSGTATGREVRCE
jgi:hypothetical protein